jgi:hypothetical protein
MYDNALNAAAPRCPGYQDRRWSHADHFVLPMHRPQGLGDATVFITEGDALSPPSLLEAVNGSRQIQIFPDSSSYSHRGEAAVRRGSVLWTNGLGSTETSSGKPRRAVPAVRPNKVLRLLLLLGDGSKEQAARTESR